MLELDASASDYLGMSSKLGEVDHGVQDFDWPLSEELGQSVTVETRMISEITDHREIVDLLRQNGFRFASLQEVLALLLQNHPRDLVGTYVIVDDWRVLVITFSSAGYCLAVNPIPGDKIYPSWAILCVRK